MRAVFPENSITNRETAFGVKVTGIFNSSPGIFQGNRNRSFHDYSPRMIIENIEWIRPALAILFSQGFLIGFPTWIPSGMPMPDFGDQRMGFLLSPPSYRAILTRKIRFLICCHCFLPLDHAFQIIALLLSSPTYTKKILTICF
ncbi:MAG: hypothetical protein A2Z14_11360 [Chloroflexi bacterium RBG_16_48_8]|nr:MAG: hypothetical protein A2Z14_11360 [Chloroflexi bacterium RBG_16_48_8]